MRQWINLKSEDTDTDDKFVIVRSKRARRIALRLDPRKQIFTLVVPHGTSLRKARKFAYDNEEWMNAKLAALPQRIPFEHGRTLPLWGKEHILHITYDPDLKRTAINCHDGVLSVRTNKEDPTSRITRFLKTHAKETMENLAHKKAACISRTIKKISVRDTKTRWGSCSTEGDISLSWRLIFAPYDAMDYVVAHEVAHLIHMDHGKKFWAQCRDLSENYVEGRYWMDNHGRDLMRYG